MVSADAPARVSSHAAASCPIKKRMVTRRRIQAHSSNGESPTDVTKVLLKKRGLRVVAAVGLAACLLPAARGTEQNPAEKPAEVLFLQLGQVGLDPGRVYKVRGASLDRSAVNITLEDGTIGFTQDGMGRITGAFFEGDGEVLLTPANEVERRSMSLFTGMAILEEHFSTAYFRFNDDAMRELLPDLRATDNQQEFVEHWGPTAQNLANADTMRLLMTFSRMLPVTGKVTSAGGNDRAQADVREDRYLHARLQGTQLGVFDVYFDSAAAEEVQAGQEKTAANGGRYYDVWTSFSPGNAENSQSMRNSALPQDKERTREGKVEVRRYMISTEVRPPN